MTATARVTLCAVVILGIPANNRASARPIGRAGSVVGAGCGGAVRVPTVEQVTGTRDGDCVWAHTRLVGCIGIVPDAWMIVINRHE
jgi:hypothetical protein